MEHKSPGEAALMVLALPSLGLGLTSLLLQIWHVAAPTATDATLGPRQ